MRSGKIGKMIYNVGNWLAKIMYLHIIWIAFTLAGLIVFGLMPATAALFTVIRKWLMKEKDIPIFKTFLDTYKSSLVEKNILGLVYLFVGVFLYYDFKISYTEIQSFPLHIIIWLICVFYLTMLAFSFPIYAHYKLGKVSYLKQTFLIVLSSPLQVILLFISFTILYGLFYYLPVIFILAGSTIVAFPIMWLGLRLFNKIEKKIDVVVI